MRYLVVVEQEGESFGAYVPDLPGCIAAASSREEVLQLIREAIEFHIEGLRGHGEAVSPLHLPASLSKWAPPNHFHEKAGLSQVAALAAGKSLVES